METIQYFEILKRSLAVTWKNKFLWLFGFFIFAGSIVSSINYNSFGSSSGQFSVVAEFIKKNPALFLILALVFLLLAVALYAGRIISISALIRSANNPPVYSQVSILKIYSESSGFFWKLLLAEIFLNVAIGAIFFLLAIPVIFLFSVKALISGTISAILALVIFIPLVVTVYFLRRYCYFFIVLGGMDIRHSLDYAYDLFLKNIKNGLKMLLASLVAGIVFSILSIFLVIAFTGVFGIFAFLAYLMLAKVGMIIVISIGALLLVLLAGASFSAYETFIQVAWLLFFQEISFLKKDKEKIAEKETAIDKVPTPETA